MSNGRITTCELMAEVARLSTLAQLLANNDRAIRMELFNHEQRLAGLEQRLGAAALASILNQEPEP